MNNRYLSWTKNESKVVNNLEKFFKPFRNNIIGYNQTFESPYGEKRIVYSDWTASGRLYEPIERKLITDFGPFVGNTHSESSVTGTYMTLAYHEAQKTIKKHVNAGQDDVIINCGFGMTAAINKFQRILGLKIPEQLSPFMNLPDHLRPVVFITHMEHHSNHTSWLETIADVVVLKPDKNGLVDLDKLDQKVAKYKNREVKIGAFSACSNVTGIQLPIHEMAKIMHKHNGFCFIDFAASAPYVNINMHPRDPEEKLDAIFFSPHKFLGGPGSAGVLIFNSKLYKRKVPDHPGGGTVYWTNPWGHHKFISEIEAREDGGTPGFLQTIKAALAIKLKQEMNVEKMLQREEDLLRFTFHELMTIPRLHILADLIEERLGIISFYIDKLHYNLIVKLLNDHFGVQVRGGCSCAGTYGHYLLHVGPRRSKRITDKINSGDLSEKPGWIRMSLHPTMTTDEVHYIVDAIRETAKNAEKWEKDYTYDPSINEFRNTLEQEQEGKRMEKWFNL